MEELEHPELAVRSLFYINLLTVAQLSDLKQATGQSKSELVRIAVNHIYEHRFHPRTITDVDEKPVYQPEPTVELEVERRR